MSEPQFIAKMQELTNKSKVMFMTSIVHLRIEKAFLKNRDVNIRGIGIFF